MRQKAGFKLKFISFTQGEPTTINFAKGIEPGYYTLFLESFDEQSTQKLTLHHDKIRVKVLEETKKIKQDFAQELQASLDTLPLQLRVTEGRKGSTYASFSSHLDHLKEKLGFIETKADKIGVKLVSQLSNLSINVSNKLVLLTANPNNLLEYDDSSYLAVTAQN